MKRKLTQIEITDFTTRRTKKAKTLSSTTAVVKTISRSDAEKYVLQALTIQPPSIPSKLTCWTDINEIKKIPPRNLSKEEEKLKERAKTSYLRGTNLPGISSPSINNLTVWEFKKKSDHLKENPAAVTLNNIVYLLNFADRNLLRYIKATLDRLAVTSHCFLDRTNLPAEYASKLVDLRNGIFESRWNRAQEKETNAANAIPEEDLKFFITVYNCFLAVKCCSTSDRETLYQYTQAQALKKINEQASLAAQQVTPSTPATIQQHSTSSSSSSSHFAAETKIESSQPVESPQPESQSEFPMTPYDPNNPNQFMNSRGISALRQNANDTLLPMSDDISTQPQINLQEFNPDESSNNFGNMF